MPFEDAEKPLKAALDNGANLWNGVCTWSIFVAAR